MGAAVEKDVICTPVNAIPSCFSGAWIVEWGRGGPYGRVMVFGGDH